LENLSPTLMSLNNCWTVRWSCFRTLVAVLRMVLCGG
jgi:hypothetical protein